MESFIDKGCKAFPIMKYKLLLLSKERFRVGVRLSTKRYGMDWTVMSFGDRNGGVFIVHIDAIKGGRILVISIGDGELGELKNSIY
jgi:hypothetical protein